MEQSILSWPKLREQKINAQLEGKGHRRVAPVSKRAAAGSRIFAHCVVYINGSCAPFSDLVIKRLVAQHGGRVSLGMHGKVTHCILGHGLAMGKQNRHFYGKRKISHVAFVRPQWVVESADAGRRLDTAKYACLSVEGSTGTHGLAQYIPSPSLASPS